jgi:hypothetical protein
MKKWLALLLCGLLLTMAIGSVSSAEESEPVDSDGKIGYRTTLPEDCTQYANRLNDGLITSRIVLAAGETFSVVQDEACGEMVLGWYEAPERYLVRQLDQAGALVSEECYGRLCESHGHGRSGMRGGFRPASKARCDRRVARLCRIRGKRDETQIFCRRRIRSIC